MADETTTPTPAPTPAPTPPVKPTPTPAPTPPPTPAPAPPPAKVVKAKPVTEVTIVNTSGFAIRADVIDGDPDRIVFVRGETSDVPVAFWSAWREAHATSDLIKNELITAK